MMIVVTAALFPLCLFISSNQSVLQRATWKKVLYTHF